MARPAGRLVAAVLVLVASGTGLAGGAGGSPASAAVKTLHVDMRAASNATRLRFQYGVDHGPLCDSGVDVSEELQAMGSSLIRTHDSGLLDWPVVFPHPHLNVSTSDPANYDFAAADEYFRRIVDSGLEPYFRLGTSWGQLGGGLPPDPIPYNRSALVDVMLHTVMHYNDGWANGFIGKAVRYFEAWNEPDSAVIGKPLGRFWNRTADEFYDLISDMVVAIKAYDPSLKVGTDGVALATGVADAPYSWGLIANLAKRGTKIDFFSWHAYTDNTDLYSGIAADVRAHLDAAGLHDVEQHVTEWFPCILCSEEDTALGAAAFGGALTKMIDSGVSLATLYPLCSSGENRTGHHGWGLFDDESVPGQAVWRKLTHVFAAFGSMVQRLPLHLPTAEAPAERAFTTLALSNGGGAEAPTSLSLLVAAQVSSCTSVELTVSGLAALPWRYEIGVVNTSTPTAAGFVRVLAGVETPPAATGALQLGFPLTAPAVAYVRLTAVQ